MKSEIVTKCIKSKVIFSTNPLYQDVWWAGANKVKRALVVCGGAPAHENSLSTFPPFVHLKGILEGTLPYSKKVHFVWLLLFLLKLSCAQTCRKVGNLTCFDCWLPAVFLESVTWCCRNILSACLYRFFPCWLVVLLRTLRRSVT